MLSWNQALLTFIDKKHKMLLYVMLGFWTDMLKVATNQT